MREEPELHQLRIIEKGLCAVIKAAGEASQLCEELRTWGGLDAGCWESGSLTDRRAERNGRIVGQVRERDA